MSAVDMRDWEDDGIIDRIIVSETFELQELDGFKKGVSLHVFDYEFVVDEDECKNLIKALNYAKDLQWY